MKKAVIENGKVVNIVEYGADGLTGIQLPLGLTLWDCTDIPVAIGDDFADGTFRRKGKKLAKVPTTEQRLAELEAQLEALRSKIGGAE